MSNHGLRFRGPRVHRADGQNTQVRSGRPDLAKRVAAETGKAPIALAVEGVGDTSSGGLVACLTEKGVHVFYSAITGKPLVAPAQPLIFRDISFRGFWLANWFKAATPDKIAEMHDRLAPLVASGGISSPVGGTYKLGQIAEAVAVASKNRGKALFVPG
jgi:NADPH:quinone reductase-like Zn-dependent oxidoreductase